MEIYTLTDSGDQYTVICTDY